MISESSQRSNSNNGKRTSVLQWRVFEIKEKNDLQHKSTAWLLDTSQLNDKPMYDSRYQLLPDAIKTWIDCLWLALTIIIVHCIS